MRRQPHRELYVRCSDVRRTVQLPQNGSDQLAIPAAKLPDGRARGALNDGAHTFVAVPARRETVVILG